MVGDLLDKLKGTQWFTKMDISWRYHNVRIKDGDQGKVTFNTNKGLFELTVMFFWAMQLARHISSHDE